VAEIHTIAHPKKRAFLVAYLECGHIGQAAAAAEIARRTHYDWLADDPEYVTEFRKAEKIAGDMLIDEARRRAHDGWEEPVFHQGEIVGGVRRFDSTLLMFLIKRHDPSYRERSTVALTDAEGGSLVAALRSVIQGKD
jgi:hypothetical protein